MPYDVDRAIKDGVPEEEIIQHLSKTRNYRLDEARKAGVSNKDILDFLAPQKGAEAKPAEVKPPAAPAPPPGSPPLNEPIFKEAMGPAPTQPVPPFDKALFKEAVESTAAKPEKAIEPPVITPPGMAVKPAEPPKEVQPPPPVAPPVAKPAASETEIKKQVALAEQEKANAPVIGPQTRTPERRALEPVMQALGLSRKEELTPLERAKASNMIALSEATGGQISPSQIEPMYEKLMEQIGLKQNPTPKEFLPYIAMAAATLLTGGAGPTLLGVARAAGGIAGYMGIKEAESMATQALTGQKPKLFQGRELSEFLGPLKEPYESGVQAGEFILPGIAAGAMGKKFGDWYRLLTIPDRRLVVQSVDEMLQRGYTLDQLREKYDNPTWRSTVDRKIRDAWFTNLPAQDKIRVYNSFVEMADQGYSAEEIGAKYADESWRRQALNRMRSGQPAEPTPRGGKAPEPTPEGAAAAKPREPEAPEPIGSTIPGLGTPPVPTTEPVPPALAPGAGPPIATAPEIMPPTPTAPEAPEPVGTTIPMGIPPITPEPKPVGAPAPAAPIPPMMGMGQEAPAPEPTPAPTEEKPPEPDQAKFLAQVNELQENTDRLIKEGGYEVAKQQPKSKKGEQALLKRGYKPMLWDEATGELKPNVLGVWVKEPVKPPEEVISAPPEPQIAPESEEIPKGYFPAEEWWEKTPQERGEAWQDMYARYEALKAEAQPVLKKLKEEYKSLKGPGSQAVKKATKDKIDALEASYEIIPAQAESAFVDENLKHKEAVEAEARKTGVSEDDLEDFVTDYDLSISEDRPYYEQNYNKTGRQIFNELLDEYRSEKKVSKEAPPVSTEEVEKGKGVIEPPDLQTSATQAVPPTAQHLELMPEEYPEIDKVAMMQDGKIFTDHSHPEIVVDNNLDPEKAIRGYTTKEGEFVPAEKIEGAGERKPLEEFLAKPPPEQIEKKLEEEVATPAKGELHAKVNAEEYEKRGPVTAYIVDGEYIRKNIDEEFSNFAQHFDKQYVPESEIWLDKENVPNEYPYTLDNALTQRLEMARGKSFNEALKRGNAVEKRERQRANPPKKGDEKLSPQLVEDAKKELLGTIGKDKIPVWLVAGDMLREVDPDFVEGGNDGAYKWMPKKTIIIDDDISPEERTAIIIHEGTERDRIINQGMTYDQAHKLSSQDEHEYREDPTKFEASKKFADVKLQQPDKDDWATFTPNELGYESRDLPGLKEGYFIAQQSPDRFDIIKSDVGSTKGMVIQVEGGKWQFRFEVPRIGKELIEFTESSKLFDTPEEAALEFNRYKDVIDRPEAVRLDEYKEFGKPETHRNAVLNAVNRGESPEGLKDYPGLAKVPERAEVAPIAPTVPPGVAPAEPLPPKKPTPAAGKGNAPLIGSYGAEGAKAEEEGGSRAADRVFGRDLRKFAKELQKELGWEEDPKHKLSSINIAPIGGDGTILMWKPDSEFGLYVSVPVQRMENDSLKVQGMGIPHGEIMWRWTTKKDPWTGLQNQWLKKEVTPKELADLVRSQDAQVTGKGGKVVPEAAAPVPLPPGTVPAAPEWIAPAKGEATKLPPGYPKITKAEDYWKKTPDDIQAEDEAINGDDGYWNRAKKERDELMDFYAKELKNPLRPNPPKFYNDLIDRLKKEQGKFGRDPFDKEQEKFFDLVVDLAKQNGVSDDAIPELREAVDEVIGNAGTKKIGDQVDDIIKAFLKDQRFLEKESKNEERKPYTGPPIAEVERIDLEKPKEPVVATEPEKREPVTIGRFTVVPKTTWTVKYPSGVTTGFTFENDARDAAAIGKGEVISKDVWSVGRYIEGGWNGQQFNTKREAIDMANKWDAKDKADQAIIDEQRRKAAPPGIAAPEEKPAAKVPTTGNRWFISDETGKLELHFTKDKFDKLPDTIKRDIRAYFLWAPSKKAWVSKAKSARNLYQPKRIAGLLEKEGVFQKAPEEKTPTEKMMETSQKLRDGTMPGQPPGMAPIEEKPEDRFKITDKEADKAYYDLGVKHAQTGQKYSPPMVGEEAYKQGYYSGEGMAPIGAIESPGLKKVIKPEAPLSTQIRDLTLKRVAPYLTSINPDENMLITIEKAAEEAMGEAQVNIIDAGKTFTDDQVDYINSFDPAKFAKTVLDYAKRNGLVKGVASEVTPPGMAPVPEPKAESPYKGTTYGKNYNTLSKLFEKWGLGRPEDFRGYQKLKAGEYMDLNVEYLRDDENGNPVLALSHNYEQQGDLVPDPDMEVRILKDGAIEAMTFQDYRSYTQVYPEPGKVDQRAKKDLNSFLGTWLKNIGEQGHAVEKIETPVVAEKAPTPQKGFAAEMQTPDGKWGRNALVFATEEEANAHGSDLFSRWMGAKDMRVVPVDEAPNYIFKGGELKKIEEAPKSAGIPGEIQEAIEKGAQDAWVGNLIKERAVKAIINKFVEDPKEVERIFELAKQATEIPKEPKAQGFRVQTSRVAFGNKLRDVGVADAIVDGQEVTFKVMSDDQGFYLRTESEGDRFDFPERFDDRADVIREGIEVAWAKPPQPVETPNIDWDAVMHIKDIASGAARTGLISALTNAEKDNWGEALRHLEEANTVLMDTNPELATRLRGIIYEGTPEKPLTNAEKRSRVKLEGKEGEGYAGEISESSADTTETENDRIRARGEGAENVPAPKKERTTEDLRTGDRPESSGQLRGSGNKGASSFAETENLPGEPTEPKRGHEKGVGRGHGNVAGVQRPRRGLDHRIEPADLVREGSWRNQAKTNLDIIELVKKLGAENRQATPEEQKLLAKYTGWGSSELANNMFPAYSTRGEVIPSWSHDNEWKPLVERLVGLLTPEEIKTAANSTQFAHYTSAPVIRSIYRALEKFGFAGGKILEPGMGVGHFFGLLPDTMRSPSVYTGIEYDKSTASIAKYLYPNQNVLHADYTKQKLPNDFFDLAIGNPPFSSTKILVDPDYKKYRFNLHEYFFVKSLDKVRPGGILTFITSRYTMDKVDDKARAYLMDRADLIGAIRLPQTAFKENAGTEVVTDVLFFRKKIPGEETTGKRWSELREITTPEGPFQINEYFADHPQMILGKNSGQGSMYGKNEYTVLPLEGDIEEHFANAVENLPENVYSTARQAPEVQKKEIVERDFNPANKKEGGLYLSDRDEIMIVDSGSGVPLRPARDIGEHGKVWLKSYLGIRDAVKKSHYDQLNDGPWEVSLEDLQKKYREFVKTHGRINEYTTYEGKEVDEDGNEIKVERRRYKYAHLFKNDIEFPLVTSLEVETETGDIIDGPALSGRTLKKPAPREIRTAPDALAVSLDTIGRFDPEHIGGLLNKPTDVVIEQLGDLIYKDPSKDAHILADEYLSGDVVTKLEEARVAAETDPQYQRNVEALIKAQPLPLTPMQVTVNLGAPWVPPEIITDFAHEILGLPSQTEVVYNPTDNSWEIGTKADQPSGYYRRRGRPKSLKKQQLRGATSEWGTPQRGPNEILESVLNNKTIKVTYTSEDKKTYVDITATAAANDVSKKMRGRFKNWVWEDTGRAKGLLDLWNSTKNNIAPRKFDGSHLTTPGVTLSWKWHDHQKRAIWRIIQAGNTYINHAVGAGKTAAYIAAGMEMKRMGLINKPIYSVPRSVLQQFANEFQELYPMANIMVADEENFHTDNRRRFIAQATLNNPDAIIITHSALGLLRMKEENIAPVRDAVLAELRDALANLEEEDAGRIRIKQMEKRIDKAEQRFDSMIQKGDNVVSFEDMGADFIFVDEAHLFRKLDFTTNRQAKGIDPVGSQRAMDLYIKTKWFESEKPGRSHVFGSGTPVTNTIGELYTVMRYFMEPEMEKEGIRHFDAWANIFGEVKTDPEMNAAGRYEMVERFSKFVNVPEMMARVRTFMDVVTMSQLAGLVSRPGIKGGVPEIVITPTSEALRKYQREELQPRIEISRAWKPSKEEPGNPDPLINIITDGRLASIDMRFVRNVPNDPNSKLNKWIDGIIEGYTETKNNAYLDENGQPSNVKGAATIAFYNLGFGAAVAQRRGFDARAWVTKRLKEAGVPSSEVAWFDDYNQPGKKDAKNAMIKEIRNGTKRILIGSAKTMGVGLNAQRRLAVDHYLDPPWYPADVEQPDGRILRQGNQNKEVVMKRYATKGSYDGTQWQMVARKSKAIEDAFLGENVRELEDISESSQYEMASALASGDERAIRVAGLKGDIENLRNLQSAHYSSQRELEYNKSSNESAMKYQRKRIKELEEAETKVPEYVSDITGKVGSKTYTDKKEFGEAIIQAYQQQIVKGDEGNRSEKIGEINGFPLFFRVWGQGKVGSYGYHESLNLRITPQVHYDIEEDRVWIADPALSPGGLVRKLVNKLNGLSSETSKHQSDLREYEDSQKKVLARLGIPFPMAQEFNQKVAELAQLEGELLSESAAATAAEAAQRKAEGKQTHADVIREAREALQKEKDRKTAGEKASTESEEEGEGPETGKGPPLYSVIPLALPFLMGRGEKDKKKVYPLRSETPSYLPPGLGR